MKKLVIAVLVLVTAVSSFAQSADDIVRNMDENQTFDTFYGEGQVVIEGRYGSRISDYTVHAKGSDNTMIEFTSGEEEGQKIFKTPDDLYIMYPYAEEIQRLSKKKTLGAVSYDEMSGEKNTLNNYDAELLGEETIDGHEVYKIRLIAKRSNVAHYQQEIFVDKETFVVWKTNYFSRSGKLTKESVVNDVTEIGGRVIPVDTIVVDMLKKNTSTANLIKDMEINIHIDDDMFSLDELSW